MPHPLLNKLSHDTLRQASIGLVIGAVGVFILSQIMPDGTNHDGTLIFDSEHIQLSNTAPLPIPAEDTQTENAVPSASQMNNSATLRYPAFAANMAPLKTEQANALTNKLPTLSLVLNHVGQTISMLDLIIDKMPNDVTVGLSPYLQDHNTIAEQLNNYGFETWLDAAAITLEPHADRGDLAISPVNNLERNRTLIDHQLDDKDHVTGVIIPNQSLIVETPDLWQDLVTHLFTNGYGILDNTADIMKPTLYFHEERRAPYIKGDKNVTSMMPLTDFRSMLDAAKQTAKDDGHMILTIDSLTPATLDILVEWVNSLSDDGITLVPLSAQAKL